jgi:hypothetical protein
MFPLEKRTISVLVHKKSTKELRWAVVANVVAENALAVLALGEAAADLVRLWPNQLRVVTHLVENVFGRAVSELGHLRVPGLDGRWPAHRRRRDVNVLAAAAVLLVFAAGVVVVLQPLALARPILRRLARRLVPRLRKKYTILNQFRDRHFCLVSNENL